MTATGPPPTPRRWSLGGLVIVAIAAYAYTYVCNLPQAVGLDPNFKRAAGAQSRFLLSDPAPGVLLSMQARCSGALTLAVSPAAAVTSETGDVLAPVDKFQGDNHEGQNLSVVISRLPVAGATVPDLLIERISSEDPRQPQLRLTSKGAPFKVRIVAVRDQRQGYQPRISLIRENVEPQQIQTATFTTAPDAVLDLTLPCRPSDETAAVSLVAGDLLRDARGEIIPDVDRRLPVRAVSILSATQTRADRALTLICGAPGGKLDWGLVPGIRPRDCEPDRISVANLALDDGLTLGIQGEAYTRIDGETHVSPLAKTLQDNAVIASVLGLGLTGLLTFAGIKRKGD